VLELDVTDEQSRVAAVRRVEAEHGAVGVLVNNAGHGGGGPVEEVPLSLVRETFDTNVFGLIRMCQLALPCMRAQRSGLIVNLGSAAGLVLIEPGAVRTRFLANSELHAPEDDGPARTRCSRRTWAR
jgi:NAD(P)-dependent dehydrogenase (short-subunit alcohol dehydrogenase family)